MAVTLTRGANVINVQSVGSSAIAIPEMLSIEGILFLAGTASSIVIRDASATGTRLYFRDGTADVFDDVCIQAPSGIHLTLVNASSDLEVILYLE